MDGGIQVIDIILLAAVAAFIALRLRSALGRRTGNEDHPAPDSVTGPGTRSGEYETTGSADTAQPSDAVVRMESDPELRSAYREIRRADSSVDIDTFMEGARAVYPMVLDAFWSGDRETLQRFLGDDVYQEFDSAIAAREEAGQTVEGRVVDLTDAKITRAALNEGQIELTVAFTAEIISVTRNAEGDVVEGELSDTVTANDVWTFARAAGSDDPAWTLIATDG